jgi:hypothetical protein
MRTAIVFLAVPALLSAQQPLPLKHTARPTTAAIDAADLMTRLYIFADDSMQGRETGTRGHIISTDYIARELKRLGLRPAGDSGTYFQNVPLLNRPFDAARSTLSVGATTLTPGVDFVPATFRGTPRAFDGAQVVFGGTFGDTSALPAADALRGKIVVFAAGRGGFAAPAFTSRLVDAAAIVRATGASLPANQLRSATWPTANMLLVGTRTAAETPLTILATDRAIEALLGGPLTSATPGASGGVVHGAIEFAETSAPARNVVAIIPGSDPALRGEYVALGAHSDHVGFLPGDAPDHDSLHIYNQARFAVTGMVPRGVRPTPEQRSRVDSIRVNVDSLHQARPARRDSIRNGADDDGSGSVTLLEIAEAFARSSTKPKRSLLFVWHTGEEKGLLGSRWFSEHTTVPRDSIVAQLNMDMIGRGEAQDIPVGAPNYLELVGSRRLSSELGDLVEAVNRTQRMPFAFDYSFDAAGHPENIYCRSDHFHYARWGIPVVFFTTGLHGDYHQVTDEPQYISYDHMARVGQLVHDIALRVGNLDHRLVVDGTRMDPNGVCRQ